MKKAKLPGTTHFRQIIIILTIVAVTAMGMYYLGQSHAHSSYIYSDAESGTLANGATVQTDISASGGKYVAFATKPASNTNPTGQFYTVGADIVGPDGKIFYPIGANVGIAGNFDWKGVATGHSADVQAWGWNTVRLNLACTNRANWSVRFKLGYGELQRRVDQFLQEYTGKKIVVMVACHEPYAEIYSGTHKDDVRLPVGSPDINQYNQSDVGKTYQQQMEGFWIDIAKKYKTNPYV